MFNLEGLIPKLCELAQEMGEDERANDMRAAGLRALSSMVISFNMGAILLFTFETLLLDNSHRYGHISW